MNIVELTKNILSMSTGRRTIVSKNNKEFVRNIYDNGYDDEMVSEWMSHYMAAAQKAITEYKIQDMTCEDVMCDVFERFFASASSDKILSERSINTYVFNTINSVVCSVLRKKNSKRRSAVLQEFDEIMENTIADDSLDVERNDIIMDCVFALRNNRFGKRVLYAMLNSGGKLSTYGMNKKIPMTQEEKNDKNSRKEICEAYNIIRDQVTTSILGKKLHRIGQNKFKYVR